MKVLIKEKNKLIITILLVELVLKSLFKIKSTVQKRTPWNYLDPDKRIKYFFEIISNQRK